LFLRHINARRRPGPSALHGEGEAKGISHSLLQLRRPKLSAHHLGQAEITGLLLRFES
jgi:hypothetical protein